MSRTITQRELRNDSCAVLRDVQAGQVIIISRNGVPVAELRPLPPRRFVPRAVIADAARRAADAASTSFSDMVAKEESKRQGLPTIHLRRFDFVAMESIRVERVSTLLRDAQHEPDFCFQPPYGVR